MHIELQNTLREIIYAEIVFAIGVLFVFLLIRFMFKGGDFLQTKGVELIMTIMTVCAFFVIPYLAITFSFSITLLIVFGLSVFLSTLLCLIGRLQIKST